jgi:hypothetical protein
VWKEQCVVKLLMGWNILPGREREYFDFYVQEFEPAMNGLGLETTDAWYTAYGEWPQIVTGSIAADMGELQQVLLSESWLSLKKQLLEYVTDYQQKIISASGGYQL